MISNNVENTANEFLTYFNNNHNTTQLEDENIKSNYFDMFRTISFFFYDFWIDVSFIKEFNGNERINISSECERKQRVLNTIRKFDKKTIITFTKTDY